MLDILAQLTGALVAAITFLSQRLEHDGLEVVVDRALAGEKPLRLAVNA